MLAYPQIDPVAIALGPLKIHWYGLMYLVGIGGAWLLASSRLKAFDPTWSKDKLSDLVFWVAMGIILGGRFGYVLFYNFGHFLADPLSLFKVWEGGMSFHGGFIGVMLATWWFGKRNDKTFFELMDFIAPLVPIGLGAGRLGNFINAELWGKATDVPWAMVFPTDPAQLPRHPSQLYQFAMEGVALFLILWLYTRKPRPTMAVSGVVALSYGCFRIIAEFVRVPDAQLGYLAFGWADHGPAAESADGDRRQCPDCFCLPPPSGAGSCLMKQYLDLMRHVREHGTFKSDRTGTGTYSVFGHQMRFNLADGFPIVTTKKCHLKSIIHELLWFLQGDTNIQYLKDNGVSIWDEWADENGNLGPVYGYQWRSWPAPNGESIDQISKLIEMIKKNPDSRRLIVSAWNPALVDQMALPPCHALFQFYVADGKLSCQLYQRSADIFLGVPFNIASYALLTLMVAQVCDLEPGEFIWTGGDCHLYANHIEQTDLQLSREPLPLPVMKLNPAVKDLLAFRFEDFELVGYQSHPHIKAPVAV